MKKSISLKSILAVALCLALVLMAGFILTACGEKKTNNDIVPTNHETELGGAMFNNSSDFELKYLGDNKYQANGSAATMDADQAAAFGYAEGSWYVIVSVKMEVGSTIVSGWKSVDTADVAFTEGEGKNTVYEGVEGVKEYVLGLTNGDEMIHADAPVWRIEVTAPNAETATSYTIDFSSFYTK